MCVENIVCREYLCVCVSSIYVRMCVKAVCAEPVVRGEKNEDEAEAESLCMAPAQACAQGLPAHKACLITGLAPVPVVITRLAYSQEHWQ